MFGPNSLSARCFASEEEEKEEKEEDKEGEEEEEEEEDGWRVVRRGDEATEDEDGGRQRRDSFSHRVQGDNHAGGRRLPEEAQDFQKHSKQTSTLSLFCLGCFS